MTRARMWIGRLGLLAALVLGLGATGPLLAQPSSSAPAASAPTASAPAAPAPAASAPASPGYGGPRPPPRTGELEPKKEAPPVEVEKREPTDYDGRPDVTSAAEDALWIPRVLFFPVYIVTEYFLRVPLGALTVAVEENDVIATIQNFFFFGPDKNIAIIPTGLIDFGFRPSVGLYFLWNDFLTKGNDLRATAAFGGIQFWKGGLANRIGIDTPVGTERSKSYVQFEANFLTRHDLLFWGVGSTTSDDDEATYGIFTWGGGARIHVEPWRGTFFEGWVTGRFTKTGAGECGGQVSVVTESYIARVCESPTLRRNVLDGAYPLPPQYGRPYATVKSGVRVALDSRDPRPAPGTGVAIDVSAEHVAELDQPALGGWLNWGGVVGAFVDLTGKQRVLGLTLAARFQDKLRDETIIPFTELVGAKHIEDVPDLDLLRGFKPGRLLGSSAIAATVDYRWPIWAFLDGTLQAGVGNTFEEPHLEDFDPELLRFSFLGGIRTPNHRDHSFNFLLGFGTKPFSEGAAPSGLRFVLGGTTGF